MIVSDIQQHPYWQPYLALAELAGVRACWSQPVITSEGKVLGTFAIYSKQPAEPSPQLLDKINSYSKLAELAISRSLSSQQIRQLAFYDSLTRLANRRLLEEHLLQVIAASQRSQKYAGLMFIDLDNFKPVNDLYGHKIGDALLVEVASRLQQSVRSADTVARFGGDEFVVLIRDMDSDEAKARQQLEALAAKIQQRLLHPHPLPSGSMHQCSCSIGLVLFMGESSSDELLRRADAAMYTAKKQHSQTSWYQN